MDFRRRLCYNYDTAPFGADKRPEVLKMARIIKVETLFEPALDVYVRLTGAQLKSRLHPSDGVIIAESPTVIEVALSAGVKPISLLTDERLLSSEQVKDIIKKCEDVYGEDFPVYTADRDTLTALTGFELTRGALAAMVRPEEKSAEEILRGARRIAVLEEIADSTNVGAIFRSAAALGIDAVLYTPTCCDPLCRRALRVSMGTALKLPFAKIGVGGRNWQEDGIRLLHSCGFKCAAMALLSDSVEIDDAHLMNEERLAIILGTEGTGLKRETIDASDYRVIIPMSRDVDSLNVGAAAAIAFWQLTRGK